MLNRLGHLTAAFCVLVLATWVGFWLGLAPAAATHSSAFALGFWIAAAAAWAAAVAMTGTVLIRTPCECRLALWILTMCASGTGVVAMIYSSVLMFGVMCVTIVGASAAALFVAARRATNRLAFCWGFSASCAIGLTATLFARLPFPDVPIVTSMWWHLSAWSDALTWHGAAAQGILFLLLTWLFAFAVGWSSEVVQGLVTRGE